MIDKKKSIRHLKVYQKHVPRKLSPFRMLPEIRLSGVWVKDAGFKIGESVIIEVNNNKITIKKIK